VSVGIPLNRDEFELALGQAILHGAATQVEIGELEPSHDALVRMARMWCAMHRTELTALAQAAERALSSEDAHTSIMSDVFANDLGGVRTFLTTCEPSYICDAFRVGTTQEGEPLRTFLQLLVDIPTWS